MPVPSQNFTTESSRRGPRAIEVLDEAVSLLRRTPLALFSLYYAGALPFCLTLIYFYFDMTQGADAERHLPSEALLLTILYFWMKICQAVFARKLLTLLEGDDAEPWNLQRWINTALLQTIYSGSFVLIYPLALIITIPFGWVSAFYHSISIVATGSRSTVRSSLNEALELCRLWPKQNHLIIGVSLCGFLFLFLNLAVFFSMIPTLLNMLLGITTVFDENESAWNNSSFYLDVLIFCFLILNPLNKAVYALRCFYGRSRLSGADLKAELHRQQTIKRELSPARALALVAILLMGCSILPSPAQDSPAPAATPPAPLVSPATTVPPDTAHLDEAIQKTLAKDEFSWRLPREEKETPNDGLFARTIRSLLNYIQHGLERMLKPVGKFVKWLVEWIFGGKDRPNSPDHSWATLNEIPWRLIFVVILLMVVGCLLWMLFRHFRQQNVRSTGVLATVPVRSVDLEAEDVRADDLPEDSWLALAQQLIERGELRLALRALYLATLSSLAHQQLIRLGPAKSNRDYLLELTRRLRGNAAAVPFFRDNITLFEASWYGTHAVTSAIIEKMRANHQQVRSHATA